MNSEFQTMLLAWARLEERFDAMEDARKLAREDNDEWRSEIREELRQIKDQTTLTNGRLKSLELWQARLGGIGSSFSWWKGAVAATIGGVIASGVTAILYLALN